MDKLSPENFETNSLLRAVDAVDESYTTSIDPILFRGPCKRQSKTEGGENVKHLLLRITPGINVNIKLTAVISGASGLIGLQLLNCLAVQPNWASIIVLTRRKLDIPERFTQVITDLDRMDDVASQLKADVAFCCLGTTLKQAGSRSQFERVDYGYALRFAQITQKQGAHHFLLVSAVGADPDAAFFYSRTKGRLERDVAKLDWQRLTVMKPSLLLGQRQEHRFAEHMAARLSGLIKPLWHGRLAIYHPIEATQVAQAMAQKAIEPATMRQENLFYPQIIQSARRFGV